MDALDGDFRVRQGQGDKTAAKAEEDGAKLWGRPLSGGDLSCGENGGQEEYRQQERRNGNKLFAEPLAYQLIKTKKMDKSDNDKSAAQMVQQAEPALR